MVFGSMPNDGGFLLFNKIEKSQFIFKEPMSEKYIRRLAGSEEFINSIERWCLWLLDVSPYDLKKMPLVMERLDKVRNIRSLSTRPTTRELAKLPSLFGEIRQPTTKYIAFPEVSSENRVYVPIGFLDSEVIATNKLYTIDGASIFHFGLLTSSMHMSWLRTVAGRLKSDFQYSTGVVYNNFPWPVIASEAKQSKASVESPQSHQDENKTLDCHATLAMTAKIEVAAQAVLDARGAHPNASLADLYDPLTMPANLLKAHQALDKAVDAAYGYKGVNTDAARVAFLFALYQKITSLLPAEKSAKKKIAKK